jgi:hypothetical protein
MKRTVALVVVCLAFVSCTTSRVNPKADITLSGSVQRQGGVPVPGARLALTRLGDAGDLFITVASVGFACLDRTNAPALCDDARFATSSSNGRFTYKIKGKDTQSTFGYSAVLALSTGLRAKNDESFGSSTTYRFHVQAERLDVPIRLWEPKLAARTGAFGARVAFPRLPAGLLPSPLDRRAHHYTIEFARGDELVWRLDDARTVTTFDPRLIEDSTGTMRVVAEASNLDLPDALGDEVAFEMRSGGRTYESPLDPPLSRGQSCGVMDSGGKRNPVLPCKLTDGTFKEMFHPSVCAGASGCTEPAHEWAYVDLGRSVPVSLVVVRGCRTCRVERSTDAKGWALVGVAQGDQAAFPLSTRRSARYIRASGPPDLLTEISVWSGRLSVPDASLLVSPQRFPISGPGQTPIATSPKKTRDFNFWALFAAMLLGVVGGAAAMLVIRRRNRPAS